MQKEILFKKFFLQTGEELCYEVVEELCSCRTSFQKIEILRTRSFGKSVFVDDKPQSSEFDHFIFNEILVHPALTLHSQPKTVFMAGGGPGSGLYEILKHPSIERVVLCDIDEEAVSFYRKYLSEWHWDAFANSKVELVFQDARSFLENSNEVFDCIIVDVPDPLENSPAHYLFTREFYALMESRLNIDGIFITQAGRTNINNLSYHLSVRNTLSTIFPHVYSYDRHIPFYGEAWGFVWASRNQTPLQCSAEEIDQVLLERGCLEDLKVYNGEMHRAIFSQPPYFYDAIKKFHGEISSDANPLTVL